MSPTVASLPHCCGPCRDTASPRTQRAQVCACTSLCTRASSTCTHSAGTAGLSCPELHLPPQFPPIERGSPHPHTHTPQGAANALEGLCVYVCWGEPPSPTPPALWEGVLRVGGIPGRRALWVGDSSGHLGVGFPSPVLWWGPPPPPPPPQNHLQGEMRQRRCPPPPSPIPTHTVLRRWGGLKADSAEVRKFIGKDRQLLCSQYKNRLCRGRGLGRGLPAAPMQKG